eukprot:5402479-Amphidinium_carterae.1
MVWHTSLALHEIDCAPRYQLGVCERMFKLVCGMREHSGAEYLGHPLACHVCTVGTRAFSTSSSTL